MTGRRTPDQRAVHAMVADRWIGRATARLADSLPNAIGLGRNLAEWFSYSEQDIFEPSFGPSAAHTSDKSSTRLMQRR